MTLVALDLVSKNTLILELSESSSFLALFCGYLLGDSFLRCS